MVKTAPFILILALFFSFQPAGHAGYFENMGKAFVRGGKNLVTAPLEIPMTMRQHHQKDQTALFTLYAGFVDGTLRAVSRFASGAYDFAAAVIPGYQEGIPPEPETLF